MSFRLFIYYCALCGGGGAFAGWVVGRAVAAPSGTLAQGVKGLFLGLAVAGALGLVDALWNGPGRRILASSGRVLAAVLVGGTGGLLGGLVGQMLYGQIPLGAFFVLGWTLTGLLVGASVGTYDLLGAVLGGQDPRGALGKVRNGVLGGTAGGCLGGCLALALHRTWTDVLADKPSDHLWSPTSWGFVALGACIGLLTGLAQVILKEAWVKVESGFRAGRELLLTKPETSIGRAEGCDIGLFGDPEVERLHAVIRREGDRFVLADAGSAAGTFVNGQRVQGPHPLRRGDAIGLGRCLLRFGERQKSAP
jgi:hypothetical protein